MNEIDVEFEGVRKQGNINTPDSADMSKFSPHNLYNSDDGTEVIDGVTFYKYTMNYVGTVSTVTLTFPSGHEGEEVLLTHDSYGTRRSIINSDNQAIFNEVGYTNSITYYIKFSMSINPYYVEVDNSTINKNISIGLIYVDADRDLYADDTDITFRLDTITNKLYATITNEDITDIRMVNYCNHEDYGFIYITRT